MAFWETKGHPWQALSCNPEQDQVVALIGMKDPPHLHQAKTVLCSFPVSQKAEGISTNLVNIEYRTRNRRMSKDTRDFDLGKRLIGLAFRVIRAAESFRARQNNRKLHNSKFLVRYSIFIIFHQAVRPVSLMHMRTLPPSLLCRFSCFHPVLELPEGLLQVIAGIGKNAIIASSSHG
jgi:hypothetical protein